VEDAGGWLARETAYRFADYAGLVADRLADRVARWITLNEPFIHMAFGYAVGLHAPGRALLLDALPVAHHQLLAHGLATAALRSRGVPEVLLTNNYTPVHPASDSEGDRTAAEVYDALHNRLFTDPVLLAKYPDVAPLTGVLPFVQDGDLAVISAPIDGLGVNYYTPSRIAQAEPGSPLPFQPMPIEGVPVTAFGWPVVPSGLHDLLLLQRKRYGAALPPIYITENGCSCHDEPAHDGAVHDPDRIAFLDGHLRAVHQAMADGVDVRGYYVWSLLDNFEWAEGYHQRFGLVYVDYETQARIPKDSYRWLRDTLAEQ